VLYSQHDNSRQTLYCEDCDVALGVKVRFWGLPYCGNIRRISNIYRVRQKYLTILQIRSEWNRWRGEFVLERSSSETQSISVAMERWSVEHRAFAVEIYFKTTILSWLKGYFVGNSIFIGTSVPSRNSSSFEDISGARCTKRNQGQWWIWNRTSGKKWQQFLPTCCNKWYRTSRNAWGNVLTRDATSQTLYSGSECCN